MVSRRIVLNTTSSVRRWLCLAVFLCSFSPPHANSKQTTVIEVQFNANGVALVGDQRQRLAISLENVRAWCPLEAAIVTTYADSREGTRQATKLLAQRLADYVAERLQTYGVPNSLAFKDVKLGGLRSSISTVEIEMIGHFGPSPCPTLDQAGDSG